MAGMDFKGTSLLFFFCFSEWLYVQMLQSGSKYLRASNWDTKIHHTKTDKAREIMCQEWNGALCD